MQINKEMENDIKFLLDAVEEFQKKYNGIYISVNHILNEKDLVASATISTDEVDSPSMNKWSNGEYTLLK